MKRSAALLLPLALTIGLVACGDDDDSDGGDAGADSDWCDLARQVEAQDDLLDDIDFTDPDALRGAFDEATGLLDDAVDVAPDEIRDDVRATSDAFGEYREALEDADYDILDVDTAVFEDIGADVEEAGDRIEAYNARECGITADTTDDTDDTVGDDTDDTTAGDTGEDEGAATTDATLPAGGTLNDMLVQQFQTMGMSEEEAQCLVDTIDIQEFTESQDVALLMQAMEDCGIDPTQLGG